MTNREIVFLVLFIASLGINMYFLVIKPEDDKDEKNIYYPTHCDDRSRYTQMNDGGGSGMTIDDARVAHTRFREAYPDETRGYIFSKMAIDRLFDMNPDANTLHVILGMEDDRKVCMLGVKHDSYTNVRFTSQHGIIKAETSCPNMCFEF